MSYLAKLDDRALSQEITQLEDEVREVRAKGLSLNMARGKPCPEQLDLSMPLLDTLDSKSDLIAEDGTDCRNYGQLMGIPEARRLFGQVLGVPADRVFVGGESSLNLMFDAVSHAMSLGVCGNEPMLLQQAHHPAEPLKWICPVPGYDRHFAITETFGFELITVPMEGDGPDMDAVEGLVADPTVKGIWCVPMYSNPTGIVFSDEVVRRMARLRPAAPDFRVFWDNAYCEHHLYDDHPVLLNIFDECDKAGNPDLVYEFCSTSKITFAGAGISAMAASPANLEDLKRTLTVQTIGHDKVNQLRHVRFLGDIEGLHAHMRLQAQILRPRFELVQRRLSEGLGGLGVGTWTNPRGGYFVSFDGLPGTAKETVRLAKECGVTLTDAGATWPYHDDVNDTNIRIAPSYPNLEELDQALGVFVTCVKLAAARAERKAREGR